MLLEWMYNSNAIEGNTLTIYETKVVLEGITIGGKSMKEKPRKLMNRIGTERLFQDIKFHVVFGKFNFNPGDLL
jgi:Fic family protein